MVGVWGAHGWPRRAMDDHSARVIQGWHEVYEHLYTSRPTDPLGGDYRGWDSEETASTIPVADMDEWRERTVERVLSLAPRRVLDVGVGLGLVLAGVAPHCEEYWGVDFAAPCIEMLAASLDRDEDLAERVVLLVREAGELDGLPDSFDVVLLNSVVQYFPSLEHLDHVLAAALARTASGGSVLVGDVRDSRVEPPSKASAQLRVPPAHFLDLATRHPAVTEAEVLVKRGRRHHELNRARYDAVLHTGPRPRHPEPETWRWCAEVASLDGLGEVVGGRRSRPVRLEAIPDARHPHRDRWPEEPAVDPETVHLLAASYGARAVLTLRAHEPAGRFDVLVVPRS